MEKLIKTLKVILDDTIRMGWFVIRVWSLIMIVWLILLCMRVHP